MKKVLAIVLVFTVVLCSSVLSVGAFELDGVYTIEYGQTLTVSVPSEGLINFIQIQFIPEESGSYALSSVSDNMLSDPYCELMEGYNFNIVQDSDDHNGFDFCLKYNFEAGVLYTFIVYDFSGSEEFQVTLGCGHNYIDGICENCSEECPHTPVCGTMGFCECGKVFAGKDIFPGDTLSGALDENCLEGNIYRFVPEKNCIYTFSSETADEETDLFADLYDKDGNWLESADDENGFDFVLYYNFAAGEEYFFVVTCYNETAEEYKVSLEEAVHKTDDGSVHSLVISDEIYSTCTEVGYTKGLYCEECEEYIIGHEEIPADGHWDINGDGICELCGGETPLPDCSHLCHSTHPFLSFFWKIIRFFNRFLGIEPFCECGSYHFA